MQFLPLLLASIANHNMPEGMGVDMQSEVSQITSRILASLAPGLGIRFRRRPRQQEPDPIIEELLETVERPRINVEPLPLTGPMSREDMLGYVGFPPPEPFTDAEIDAGRIPAEVPTWVIPGGRFEVPGGDASLARLREQAKEWLARMQGNIPSRRLNLSLPPAGPAPAQFPARVIHEDYGRESELAELQKRQLAAAIDREQAAADAMRLQSVAQVAKAQADREQQVAKSRMNRAIVAAAEELASQGASMDEAVAALAPLYEQAWQLGVTPDFASPTAIYSYILEKRNKGARSSAGVPPPPPRRASEELLKKAGLTK